jgi:hypothetical protein
MHPSIPQRPAVSFTARTHSPRGAFTPMGLFRNSSPHLPMSTHEEEKLLHRGIRPTAARLLVLRALLDAGCALSLADCEARLGTMERSTVFRALSTFAEHHLVHHVEDGTGQVKYALCADDCHCGETPADDPADLHLHFVCERCHRTLCLPDVPIPIPPLPDGFVVHTAGYVVRGICADCATRSHT